MTITILFSLLSFLQQRASRFVLLLLCLSSVSSYSCWADLATDTIYLTWQKSPSTTMTVQWITPPEQTQTIISYRAKKAPLTAPTPSLPSSDLTLSPCETENQPLTKIAGEWMKFPSSPQYIIHRVELQNLEPDTDYLFKILPYPHEYSFHTAPAELNEKGIRFVVGGDMYHDDIKFMNAIHQQAAKTSPLFALLGGDIAYAVTSLHVPIQKMDRWIEWIKAWHASMVTPEGHLIPVITAIGNHDLIGQYDQTPAQAAVFSALFPMPGPAIHNVLDFNSYLSIFILDSGHAHPIAGAQTLWLQDVLKCRKESTHKLAVYHVPAYPSFRDYFNHYSTAIRRHWIPLFESGGIQTAFEHHDHAYKRTHPLLKNRVNPQGITYLGDGGWGVEKPRAPGGKQKRNYLAKALPIRHFILATLTPTHQLYKAVNDQGQTIDEYVKELRQEPQALQSKIAQLL